MKFQTKIGETDTLYNNYIIIHFNHKKRITFYLLNKGYLLSKLSKLGSNLGILLGLG